jgi:flavin-dependent dehydrogenase
MPKSWDAVVIGARCAGSPTAMLLARRGFRVLLVDRATFPSDTISTHVVQPLGAAALSRWGLLDRLAATGCPPIHTSAYDFGRVRIEGSPGTAEAPVAYAPRRTVLDKLLVDAAVESGAELRESFVVEEILFEGDRAVGIRGRSRDGAAVTELATVVVGAEGKSSKVAAAAGAELYNERPILAAAYYSYWSGLPMNHRFETYIKVRRGFAAVETHDGWTMVVAGWPIDAFEANRRDVEGSFHAAIELVPEFSERLRAGKREARFAGATVPNYYRKPYGPGWALVGDAGYQKDPVTAQGILDAFRDAELCAGAIAAALSGDRPYDEAMAEYQQRRDEATLPMYEMTCQIASFAQPPPEMPLLLAAASASRESSDDFVRANAGTLSPAKFFHPDNVARVFERAGASGS